MCLVRKGVRMKQSIFFRYSKVFYYLLCIHVDYTQVSSKQLYKPLFTFNRQANPDRWGNTEPSSQCLPKGCIHLNKGRRVLMLRLVEDGRTLAVSF